MPILEGKKWRVAQEHFPLALASVCRNCEAVFEAQPVCPACTSRSVQGVETYCGGKRDARQRAEFVALVAKDMVVMTREQQ